MKHSVNFNNRGNKWDNALPIGNGVLGAIAREESKKEPVAKSIPS